MYTIKDLAKVLGLSEKQVRRRLSILAPYLDGACRKGPRGKILVDEQVVDLLRTLLSRERAGISLNDAAKEIVTGLRPTSVQPEETPRCPTVREDAANRGKVEIPTPLLGVMVVLQAATLALALAALIALLRR